MGLVAKAFQDIITFSRATQTGTYVNSNGYITNSSVLNYLTYSNQPENAAWTKTNSFVQQNLLLRSEEFDNATWGKASNGAGVAAVVTANQGVAPDGTLTADRVDFNCGGTTVSDRSWISQTATSTIGAAYTDSIWIKAFDAATVGKTIRFILENGGASGTNIFTITSEWQRISVTGAGATGASVNVLMETRGTYTSSTTASVLLWGAQLVQGSVPGDYRATTSAALPCLYADYNGALRARKFCENAANAQHYMSNPNDVFAGTVYTFSFKAKAGEKTQATYTWSTASSAFASGAAAFNLATGVVTPSGAATGTMTLLGNGWYLCTSTNTCTATVASCANYVSFTGLTAYTGDGSSGIYIADAQLNDGSSALAYYDTTQYAYNAPRFDYDPVTLAAKGLLVEESRANLLVQSSDYATSWILSRATVTSNAVLSPDGTATADKLVATAAPGTHRVYQGGITNSGTTTRTLSAYFKAAEYSYAGLMLSDATETDQVRVQWNLSTGVTTVANVGTTIALVSSSMQNLSNGWVRCIMTCTIDTSEPSFVAWLFVLDNTNASSFTGDGVSGVYAWGAQCETGAFATSYIPTVGSQVTRAADLAVLNTLSPWFNSAASTVYIELQAMWTTGGTGNDRSAWSVSGGTNPLLGVVRGSGGSIQFHDETNYRVMPNGTYSDGSIRKVAIALADPALTANAAINGTSGSVITDGSTLDAGTTAFNLGASTSPGNFWCGWIRRFTYYPRQMTLADCATLTTL